MPKGSKQLLNKLFLLFKNDDYLERLCHVMRKYKKPGEKVCYVCLSKPYTDIIDDLNNLKHAYHDFIFVDTLSDLKYPLEPVDNCIFVQGIGDLDKIRLAVKQAVERDKCSIIVFDDVSSLLVYSKPHHIVVFTHKLLTENAGSRINKCFLVQKEGGIYKQENVKLINDLHLFADKVIRNKKS